MQTTTVKTSPAPNPLPNTWLRAIANSITTAHRENKGWLPHTEKRAWHPTGAPRGNGITTTGTIPRSGLLNTTEVITEKRYLFGTVDPIQAINLPAIAWYIERETADATLADRPDLQLAFQHILSNRTRVQPFNPERNRHGNITLRPNPYTTSEERDALILVAAACTIRTLTTDDYWDWLTTDFGVTAVLDLLL